MKVGDIVRIMRLQDDFTTYERTQIIGIVVGLNSAWDAVTVVTGKEKRCIKKCAVELVSESR